jgi:16S rRNA (cytosine967-C5)-methyltransferase
VLRRAAGEREALLGSLTDGTPAAAAVAHSVPAWLAEMWWDELGPEVARPLLRAINVPLPTVLRVNTLRAEPAALAAELLAAGEPAAPPALLGDLPELPEALEWDGPLGPAALAALEDGRAFAQSVGAQVVVAVLHPQPGERVLDLCAGPGVKTTAIAARMRNDGEVVAVERDPARAGQIAELAERAGATAVRVVVGDAAELDAGRGYDRVLVDPPCSDLGTLASRPDARWRKDPATIDRLAPLQAAVLARGRDALRPGGELVYSTCTISRRENEDVTEHADRLDVARLVRTRPETHRTDGFFIAGMRRDDA